MFLGMLRAQPRHVVAKLAGMSSAEEEEVLKDLPPAERQADGTPLYRVADCSRRTTEVRTQLTLGAILDRVVRLDDGVQHAACRVDLLSEKVDACVGKTDYLAEGCDAVKREVTLLNKAYRRDPRKPYLENKDIQEEFGLHALKVRRLAEDPECRKHLIHGTRKPGSHKKYSPAIIDVLEKKMQEEKRKKEQSKARSRKGSSRNS